ncbi:hypothetical protein [Erythrobacter sp. CCH5-A1]|jgi:hypothetical protein|uniref:hypothetical protein n=1 Tax=Erythrobacter sp. CCH5-A1 TaxID=1768792 RepID=UPI00082A5D28|nr:hypothetical protein [Erythrobacter sp. CCH5-A1]
MSRIKGWLKNPTHVLAAVGLSGFGIDMFYRPISNAGLILLALACAPWLTKLVKSAKVAGVEFELADSAPPQETAERLATELTAEANGQLELTGSATAEVAEVAQEQPVEPVPVPSTIRTAQPLPGSGGMIFAPDQNLALAYLLEGLVLQDLQADLGGLLQRDVRLPTEKGIAAPVDGLLVRNDEAVLVEVKLFINRPPQRSLIIQAVEQAAAFLPRLKLLGYSRGRAIVAVVIGSGVESRRARELQRLTSEYSGVTVKVFRAEELLSRYGFDPR